MQKRVRRPGIEPGASRWQRDILPLNQRRFVNTYTPQNKQQTQQHTTHLAPFAKRTYNAPLQPQINQRIVTNHTTTTRHAQSYTRNTTYFQVQSLALQVSISSVLMTPSRPSDGYGYHGF
jgi:hypothetical protein